MYYVMSISFAITTTKKTSFSEIFFKHKLLEWLITNSSPNITAVSKSTPGINKVI
jgi:hypothetical protein